MMAVSQVTRPAERGTATAGLFNVEAIPVPPWKRIIDIAGASAGLLLLSPLFLVVSLAILLDDHGPPFYRQTRVGRGGRLFTCWKFRSMCQGADRMVVGLSAQNEANGHIFKMRDDPRRTRVGKLLRRSSLDELPQLINVLRGEMSIVGPRPPTIPEVLNYNDHEAGRLAANPGITGLWQVTLRRERHDFADMVELDLRYAAECSLWLDLTILVKTIPTVLGGKGSF
jgi:lipopolysaccharide/colanic/teichoic acid biosynthesis glycosyltransferase